MSDTSLCNFLLVTHLHGDAFFAIASPSSFIRLLFCQRHLKQDTNVLSSAVRNKCNDGESQHVVDEVLPEVQREKPKFGLASVLGKLEGDKDRKLGKHIKFE